MTRARLAVRRPRPSHRPCRRRRSPGPQRLEPSRLRTLASPRASRHPDGDYAASDGGAGPDADPTPARSAARSSSCCPCRCSRAPRARSFRCSRRRSREPSSRRPSQNPLFARQLLAFVFGLAPVALVIHLLHRDGATVGAIGFRWDDGRRDIARGVALFAVVGLAGLGIYLAAVCLGVNRFVVPAPPPNHWWTYPAVFMNAVRRRLPRRGGRARVSGDAAAAAGVVTGRRSSSRARCCEGPTTSIRGGAASSGTC